MSAATTPRLIIHGGMGRLEGNLDIPDNEHAYAQHRQATTRLEDFRDALTGIATDSHQVLLDEDARAAVLHALRLLEDHPLFNAGTGSRIQGDGKVRMSAALMDGPRNLFSGVINVEAIRHPIDLAALLAEEEHTVLAGEQANAYARERGFLPHDPITPERRTEYEKLVLGKTGTVGAVALDSSGRICAGTSTGGVGGETPGRVSDAATVAGTYASEQMGVSCTGVGEQIVNQAAAAKLATRVLDGMALPEAVRKTIAEADALDYRFGLIGLDRQGGMEIGQTRGVNVLFASHDGATMRSFFDSLAEQTKSGTSQPR
ncbi:MAG: isoaspartyl peptidase/L-asparaginase [SAR324 cluster bacterium]|nr:isoaspartyl peptidase/L-asparaginase [SAR324 cluster bacterium]